jgi:hypothetical protein
VNQQTSTLDYFYNNGNLIKIVSSENYELDFIHNSNATVNYEKVSNVNNVQVLEYHGTLYFQGDNAIEDKRVLDNTVSNELHKQEVRYNFDSKINPLIHITGYSKLLDRFATISANNAFSSIEIYSVNYLDTSQDISSATLQPRSYQYDNNNYPTENVSEYPVFGPRYSNHLKSLYFYD